MTLIGPPAIEHPTLHGKPTDLFWQQEDGFQFVVTTCPGVNPSWYPVVVGLGNYLAEIHAIRHTRPQRTTYSYSIFTIDGEKLYESGNGYLWVDGLVEKAAHHLEIMWNTEQY